MCILFIKSLPDTLECGRTLLETNVAPEKVYRYYDTSEAQFYTGYC